MKVLLTGASGFIGGHILQALESTGHEVIAADRRHGTDFNKMLIVDDWLPHLQDIDAVINSVGIIAETSGQSFINLHQLAPEALFLACTEAGVARVIQISALGADEQAFTPYQLSKKYADDVLRGQALDWFVLRPSLVYGEGGASMAMFQRMARVRFLPFAGGAQQLIQPIHISDLVDTVLQCLHMESARRTVDVVGPYSLTLAEWLKILGQKQGKKPVRILAVPVGLAMAAAWAGHFLVPLLHPDNLRMLQKGNIADVQPLIELLGHAPVSVVDAP